jgi:hypothetical protein
MLAGPDNLIFQWHHRLIAAAEGRHVLETAVRLLQQHNRAVTKHGMAIFRHVPRTTLASLVCHGAVNR